MTLGMLGVARGVELVLSNGKPVYGLSDAFVYHRPFGIPMPAIVALVAAALAHYVLAQVWCPVAPSVELMVDQDPGFVREKALAYGVST